MPLPNRKSTKLQNFDYSSKSAYFLTICTNKKQKILSEIHNEKLILSELGIICKEEIENLHKLYNIEINNYVIMPNHIHILLLLLYEDEEINKKSILQIIGGFKSITTKKSNKIKALENNKLWQRSFHDHVVRNEEKFILIRDYIENNVMTWAHDKFHV